ncbi:hypothetical protein AWC29_13415 [Mycobacterium triplex]|uniref:Uncharacterized protein n=1 Tax=Mycobacterium triplex TaxID=47839 RepID=A0ABX3W667_9MYCO|nr:hypothetical protein AWC29_13415 [Mycobacterium triplex]
MPAEAGDAVHTTPAAKTADAAPMVAVNTRVFMSGFLFFEDDGTAALGPGGDNVCSTALAE